MELVLHPNLSPFIHFLELLLCSEKCLRITRKSVNNSVITHWYFKPQKTDKKYKDSNQRLFVCSKSFSWGDNPIVNMIFCVGSNLATWSCLIINEKKKYQLMPTPQHSAHLKVMWQNDTKTIQTIQIYGFRSAIAHPKIGLWWSSYG